MVDPGMTPEREHDWIRDALRETDRKRLTNYDTDFEHVRAAAKRSRAVRQWKVGSTTLVASVVVAIATVNVVQIAGTGRTNQASSIRIKRSSTTDSFVRVAAESVSMVGDSVMLGAESTVKTALGPVAKGGIDIDASVGRSADACVSVLDDLAKRGKLAATVVVHCGTNGPLHANDVQRIMKIVGPNRRIAFLTVKVPRTWEASNNSVLRTTVQPYRNATILEYGLGAQKWTPSREYFAKDQFHLTKAGSRLYADLIANWITAPVPFGAKPMNIVQSIDTADGFRDMVADGADVWVARREVTTNVHVLLERRDAATGALRTSLIVQQESVFSIATDHAGSIWIVGGGDGGVPDTTVSRIDTKTNRVRFTKKLNPVRCVCRIAATSNAVWLGANAWRVLYHLNRNTGAVAGTIKLPDRAVSLLAAHDGLGHEFAYVGMENERVAVVNGRTGLVERTVHLRSPAGARGAASWLHSVTLVGRQPGDVAAWATLGDGTNFEIVRSSNGAITVSLALDKLAEAMHGVARRDGELWSIANRQVRVVRRGAQGLERLVSTFEPMKHTFSDLIPDAGGPSDPNAADLSQIVATPSTLWIADANSLPSTIRIVRIPFDAAPLPDPPPVLPGFQPIATALSGTASVWVLGTDVCDIPVCTVALQRSRDNGATWSAVAAPETPFSAQGDSPIGSTPKLRFINDTDGVIEIGEELWVTHDGAKHWAKVALPESESNPGLWGFEVNTGRIVLLLESKQRTVQIVSVLFSDLVASNPVPLGSTTTIAVNTSSTATNNALWRRETTSMKLGSADAHVSIVSRGANMWVVQTDGKVLNGLRFYNDRWQTWSPPCVGQDGLTLAAGNVRQLVAACRASNLDGAPTATTIMTSNDGGATFGDATPVTLPDSGVINGDVRSLTAHREIVDVQIGRSLYRRANGKWQQFGVEATIASTVIANDGRGVRLVVYRDTSRVAVSNDDGATWTTAQFN